MTRALTHPLKIASLFTHVPFTRLALKAVHMPQIVKYKKAEKLLGSQPKLLLRTERRTSMMTCHYPCRSGKCYWLSRLRNQKNYPGSDTSKVWNFCTRSSDVISRGNQSCCREMSAVFLGCSEVFMYLLKFARKISLMMILTFKLLANFCCLTELKH